MAPLQDAQAFDQFLAPAASAEWVVYAKAPFGGPEQVLDYLGRYTHRVAISNSRLVDFSDGSVAFRWKDYRHDSQPKVMRLPAAEFMRRFLLHVLPSGFQRIRHYGLLANRTREAKLERCRELLGVAPPAPSEHDQDEDYRDRYLRLTGLSLRGLPGVQARAHGVHRDVAANAASTRPARWTRVSSIVSLVSARGHHRGRSSSDLGCARARECMTRSEFDPPRGYRSACCRTLQQTQPLPMACQSPRAPDLELGGQHRADSIPITPHRLRGRISPTGSFTHPTRTSSASMIRLRAPRRPGKRLSAL